MPRLHHRKSRIGCLRCKSRKVKCDEAKPKCGACTRHHVECEYAIPVPPETKARSRSVEFEKKFYASAEQRESPQAFLHIPWSSVSDAQLELRLLHHFTVFTSASISPKVDAWKIHVPRLAFQYRFLFDAMMAVSALHLSRDDYLRSEAFPDATALSLLQMSDEFFGYALKAYQSCLDVVCSQGVKEALDVELFEAIYAASSMVSLCAISQLGRDYAESLGEESTGEVLWFKLTMGQRPLVGQWKHVFGNKSWHSSRFYNPVPDLSNHAELFNPDNRELLEPLLQWAAQYVVLDTEERQAYEHTLSYLGLIYHKIYTSDEPPQSSCHRLRALPARVPRRFGNAVVLQQPLALTILAFIFAMMKLVEDVIPWFSGIAQRQVGLIQEKLPLGWRKLIQWPLGIADGSISSTVQLYVGCED